MHLNRSQVLAGILLASLLLIGLWAWSERAAAPTVPEPETQEETAEPSSEAEAVEPGTALVREEPPSPTIALSKVAETQGTATLVVDGARYALTAPEDSTLKEALDTLDAESDFSYVTRTYAGLGSFVTHINGRAGTGEYVWILYVNGEQSPTGISATRIRSGDVIEWKLEESY